MDQFALMVETLTDYSAKRIDNFIKDEEESTNESLALVESTLLHGYPISDVSLYLTTYKRITERLPL